MRVPTKLHAVALAAVLVIAGCADAPLHVEPALSIQSTGFSISAATFGPNWEIEMLPSQKEICGSVWSGSTHVFNRVCTTDWIYAGAGGYYNGGFVSLWAAGDITAIVDADLSNELVSVGPIPSGVAYLEAVVYPECSFASWNLYVNGVFSAWAYGTTYTWQASSGVDGIVAYYQC